MKEKFSYMGRDVKVSMNKAGNEATITIDRKKFIAMLHTAGEPEDNYIRLWKCPDGYVMTETPELMARHIVQYWHQYT